MSTIKPLTLKTDVYQIPQELSMFGLLTMLFKDFSKQNFECYAKENIKILSKRQVPFENCKV